MKFKYLLVHEDAMVTGTNDEECARAFGETNCATLVIDLTTMKTTFERNQGEVKEQNFNPEDWK